MRLVIRSPNWIGDSVMAIPAIKAIKGNIHEYEVWVCGVPWVIELYKNLPFIDGLLEIKKGKNLKTLRENVTKLKAHKFSKGILFTNSFYTSLEIFLAGIPERIGYSRDFRSFLLSKSISVGKEKKHHVFYYLDLLTKIGFKIENPSLELSVTEEERKNAKESLIKRGVKPEKLKIGINPGAYYGEAKRWKTNSYGILANLLKKKLDANIIIFGSKEEKPIAEGIVKFGGDSVIPLTGETTLRELMAYISLLDLFITNDSGPMHIANALRVPIVAIFGPTSPESTSPFHQPYVILKKNVSCAPCNYRVCPIGHTCMTQISVEEVFSAVMSLLEK
ncbi:MAG: lipopolysaccharide heptosyltransferase II [Candidatus Aminicenantia bacterium]